MTRSVFQKACPSCAVLVSASASVCDCGYSFDKGVVDTGDGETVDAVLYANYLSARLAQTRDTLETLRTQLAADPGNHRKAIEVMNALQELNQLREEIITTAGEAAVLNEPSPTPSEEFRAQQASRADAVARTIHTAVRRTPAPWRVAHPGAGLPTPTGNTKKPT
jgi:hypothetical protein